VLVAAGIAVTTTEVVAPATAHVRKTTQRRVIGATGETDGTHASAPSRPPRAFAPFATDSRGGRWIASWGAAPQAPSRAQPTALRGFRNVTLRQIVISSSAGTEVRVRFSNAYGRRPLRIGAATVAIERGHGAGLVARTLRRLHFGGSVSVRVPAGADALSDPVGLAVRPFTRLAISTYLPSPTGPATVHPEARQRGFLGPGDRVTGTTGGRFHRRLASQYLLDGLDTLSPARYDGALVAFGDSITAGVGATVGAMDSWPEVLGRRLNALSGDTLSVVNEGIGGNRVLNDAPCCGPNAVARFGADAIGQTGVREVILLEGVNDLGYSQKRGAMSDPHTDVTAEDVVAGYEQIIAQAHAAGLRIIGATLTPFRGARYWTPAAEAKREQINHWILTSGAFDGVIDFAGALADPAQPQRLDPRYDSGDHLHPNDAGYRAMAAAIDLRMLTFGLS